MLRLMKVQRSVAALDPEDLNEGLEYAMVHSTTNISLPNADWDSAIGEAPTKS